MTLHQPVDGLSSDGSGLEGQDSRLDIEGESIDDEALARLIVQDLRLLMVDTLEIAKKRYVVEPHKRAE